MLNLRGARCLVAAILIAALLLVPIGVAQAADATITATGSAQVKPKPADRKSEASIAKAVEAAEDKALPVAIAEAKDYAAKLAKAAGIRLGALLSVANAPAPGYPFGPFLQQNGTFGNGKFCGKVRNTKLVKLENGARRRVALKGTHKVCRVPFSVSASVSLTFAVAP